MSAKPMQTLAATSQPPYRCNHCKSHTLVWDGYFYLCSRLDADPTTGKRGCGRAFLKDVYEGESHEQ